MDLPSFALGLGIIFGGLVLALLMYALYMKILKNAVVTDSKLDDVILAALGKHLVILVVAVEVVGIDPVISRIRPDLDVDIVAADVVLPDEISILTPYTDTVPDFAG